MTRRTNVPGRIARPAATLPRMTAWATLDDTLTAAGEWSVDPRLPDGPTIELGDIEIDPEHPRTWKKKDADGKLRRRRFADVGVEVTDKPLPPELADLAFDDPNNVDPFEEVKPWQRVPGETGRQYEFFLHYLSLGLTRTYNQVARDFDVSGPRINTVAKDMRWQDRAVQWDRYREQIYQLELAEETREMARRHARIARRGVEALAIAFAPMIEEAEDDPELFRERFADQKLDKQMAQVVAAARAIPGIMNAERLSRGMPTEISESHSTTVSHSTVIIETHEDLAELLTILDQTTLRNPNGQIGPGDEASITTPGGSEETEIVIDPEDEQVHTD